MSCFNRSQEYHQERCRTVHKYQCCSVTVNYQFSVYVAPVMFVPNFFLAYVISNYLEKHSCFVLGTTTP